MFSKLGEKVREKVRSKLEGGVGGDANNAVLTAIAVDALN
jgi:hypothetical protein